MFEKILSPITTATSVGVLTRYAVSMVSAVLAILSSLHYLTEEQAAALTEHGSTLVTAIFGLVAIVLPIYAARTKSSSDRASEVAKKIDKVLPPSVAATVKTPDGIPDIPVPPEAKT